jgi:hypothetical protein
MSTNTLELTSDIRSPELPVTIAAEPVTWWTKARCNDGAGTLAHLFFSDEPYDVARAKAICAKCPVRAQCLGEALDRAEPWGVWGGELFVNGQVVTGKRPRGRPPRFPRPELIVDEVPLPPGYREAKTA